MYSSKNICYNDTSCDCFFITDACNDNVTCEYDTRFSEITGYDSLSETDGRDLLKIIHPDDLNNFLKIKKSVSAKNPFESLNLRLIRKDRSVSYVRCNLIYTTTDDNYERIIYAFSVLGDSEYFRQHDDLIKSMQPIMFKFRFGEEFPFFYNDSFIKITGYTREEAEASSLSYIKLINPHDLDHFIHTIKSAAKSNTISACTIRVTDKNKKTNWINCSFKKMSMADGQEYFIGIGEDISEQKKAEYNLSKNKMLLKNITENLSCATLSLNENEDKADLIRMNNGFLNLFGYTEEEIEKHKTDIASLIIHHDDRNDFIHGIMRTGSGMRNVCRAVTRDRKIIWISYVSFSSMENDRPCYVCTFHDVTHLKDLETELRATQKALARSVSENSKISCIIDFSDNTLRFDDLFIQKYDIPSVIYDMPEGIFKNGMIHESFHEAISSLYYKIKQGESEGSCIFKYSLPGHSSSWLRINVNAVKGNDGRIAKAIGIITDISEHMTSDEIIDNSVSILKENEIFSCVINLSRSRIIRCSENSGDLFAVSDQMLYDSVFITSVISRTFPMDRCLLAENLSIKTLWKNYIEDNHHHEFEFRIRSSEGHYIWVKASMNYSSENTSDNVILSISITDITNLKKNDQLSVPENDPAAVTPAMLLSKVPFSAMVNDYIARHSGDDKLHALYILDLNGFKDISRIHGQKTGKKILDAVTESLLSIKRPSIAGKMYGDEFLIFIKDIESYDDLNITAKQLCGICKKIDIPEIEPDSVSGCVGVSFSPVHGDNFETLYKKAEIAMYNAKRFDKTRYAIYSNEDFTDRRHRNLDDFKTKAAEKIKTPGITYHLYNADIRHFRNINHILGYEKGDRILQEICNMLQEFLKSGEYFTRIFADNFLILTLVHDEEAVRKRMEEINYRLQEMHITDENEIQFSAGLVTIDDSNRNTEFEQLIDCAIMAHENARKAEGTSFVNFVPGMGEEEIRKFEILSEISEAIKSGQICTFVQPQFDILNREYVSMEALVRWNHPVKGMLTPDKFISVCEENGFISSIDFCVLEQMCSYIRNRLDMKLRVLPVAINQSQITIHEKGYLNRIISLVEKYKIPPEYIELEVTESACVNNPQETISILTALRDYGFRISMDDFGTGYSTLNLLKDIPVDALKIDRAFLTETMVEKKPTEIIKSITNMAHNINIRVVCEGVEFARQIPFLEQIGCELVQGFLFGKPMPYDQVAAFIDSNETPWPDE